MNNYDRIKSMSVEEMEEFLSGLCENTAIKVNGVYVVNDVPFIRQWLLQEVSDENN